MAWSLQVPGQDSWEVEQMNAEHSASERIATWLESEYCASVAATLLARNEYFELLEDAMVPPARLMSAYSAWRRHATQTEVLGGLVETPAGTA